MGLFRLKKQWKSEHVITDRWKVCFKKKTDRQTVYNFDSTRKCNIYDKRCISKPSNPTIASPSVRHQNCAWPWENCFTLLVHWISVVQILALPLLTLIKCSGKREVTILSNLIRVLMIILHLFFLQLVLPWSVCMVCCGQEENRGGKECLIVSHNLPRLRLCKFDQLWLLFGS